MSILNLSTPWDLYYREIEALFKDDPQVKVVYDEEAKEVKLYVENAIKADALTQLLPAERNFGGVELKITVIPANVEASKVSLFRSAFDGNPALEDIISTDGPFATNYVIFKNKVVQYYSDNLGSYYGMTSTLYEDIAKDVFDHAEGIFFCTELGYDTLPVEVEA